MVVRAYLKVGKSYTDTGAYAEAIPPYRQALSIAQDFDSDSLQAEIHYLLGYIYYLLGDYPQSLDHQKALFSLNENHTSPRLKARTYALTSSIYLNIGDIDQSVDYQQMALEAMEVSGDSIGFAYNLYLLSTTYFNQGVYQRAMLFVDSAYKISTLINWDLMIYSSLAEKGDILLELGNYDEAMKYADWSARYADSISYPLGIAYSMGLKGDIFARTFRQDSAIHYLKKGQKLNAELGYRAGKISTLVALGRVYSSVENYDLALEALNDALAEIDATGMSLTTDNILEVMAETHFRAGNMKEAYEYNVRHSKLRDSLFNDQVVQKIAQLSAGYEIRKTEKEKIAAVESERNKLYLKGGIIALVLLALLALVLFSRYRLQTRANELLNFKNSELARTNQELEQFAYVASHDLKEPLRMIGSYVGLLKRKYPRLFDSDAKEYMTFIEEGVTRMDTLLKDLMLYARINEEESAFVLSDVDQVVKSALKFLRPTIEESGADITISWMPRVMANPSQLNQLFLNLISNALKYRGEAPPRISISSRETEDEVIFLVEDNGIGIEEAYQENIFSIFQRLHQREQYEGTGIGLAICRKIADNHNGHIWVESTPGQGSTFYFAIPRNL